GVDVAGIGRQSVVVLLLGRLQVASCEEEPAELCHRPGPVFRRQPVVEAKRLLPEIFGVELVAADPGEVRLPRKGRKPGLQLQHLVISRSSLVVTPGVEKSIAEEAVATSAVLARLQLDASLRQRCRFNELMLRNADRSEAQETAV